MTLLFILLSNTCRDGQPQILSARKARKWEVDEFPQVEKPQRPRNKSVTQHSQTVLRSSPFHLEK